MTSDTFPANRELVLTRSLKAPRSAVWRCWTDPSLIVQWFTPPPWRTVHAEMDVRPGGSSLIVMRGPDGTEMPNPGIFLEVDPERRLVFTDAYNRAWEPAGKPFMTGILTFEDAPEGGTLYTAVVRHWSEADREAHEKMGFHEGWGIATTQLEALAASL